MMLEMWNCKRKVYGNFTWPLAVDGDCTIHSLQCPYLIEPRRPTKKSKINEQRDTVIKYN